MSGRKSGPKIKLTPSSQAIICEMLSLGMSQRLASDAAGICVGTFHLWRKKGRDHRDDGVDSIYSRFLIATQRAVASNAKIHLLNMARASKEGSWQASAWMLERRHGYHRTVVFEDSAGSAVDNSRAARLMIHAHRAGLFKRRGREE